MMTRSWWRRAGLPLTTIALGGVAFLVAGWHAEPIRLLGAFWIGMAAMGFLIEAAERGQR